jgi:hypothetical protein
MASHAITEQISKQQQVSLRTLFRCHTARDTEMAFEIIS